MARRYVIMGRRSYYTSLRCQAYCILLPSFLPPPEGNIIASSDESTSFWQQKDYKFMPPGVDWDNVDWDSAPAIQVRKPCAFHVRL